LLLRSNADPGLGDVAGFDLGRDSLNGHEEKIQNSLTLNKQPSHPQ